MRYSREHTLRTYDLDPHTLRVVATPVRVTWSVRAVQLPRHDDRAKLDHYAALGRWDFTLPGCSPISERYSLGMCHLRPIRGGTPVVKLFPAASHELIFAMCDPDSPSWFKGTAAYLRPFNYVVQVAVRYDHAAIWLSECIARAVVEGRVAVEPQGVRGAQEMFAGLCRELQEQARRIFRSDI